VPFFLILNGPWGCELLGPLVLARGGWQSQLGGNGKRSKGAGS
jgi:hypothetical protein